MVNRWPQVPLGNLLKHVQRRELVEPNKTYDILGAHWYAKGLYTKDAKPGTQIRAKYLYRVDQGDFVYNRLFGWKGSFAVASDPPQWGHADSSGLYMIRSLKYNCLGVLIGFS